MIKPMLAETGDRAFNDPNWIWELKLDGVRATAELDQSTRLFSRSGKELTAKFPEFWQMHKQAKKPTILDGEIVATSLQFHDIQKRVHKEKAIDIQVASGQFPAIFYAFDILNLDRQNLMPRPLRDRKERLNDNFTSDCQARILPFSHLGTSLMNEVKQAGLEGIMGKDLRLSYSEGKRCMAWLKVKCFQEGQYYICGLTEGENARASAFGALVLGEVQEGKLRWIGNCGTGFTEQQLSALLTILSSLKGNCPLPSRDVGRPVKFWVEPKLKVEVRYQMITPDGKLRMPSFRKVVS